MKLAFFGTAVEATEAVSPPNPWYTGVNPYNGAPDLDKAKSLMSKAKQGNVTVTYLNTAGDTISTTMGELIKSQLAPLGISREHREPVRRRMVWQCRQGRLRDT